MVVLVVVVLFLLLFVLVDGLTVVVSFFGFFVDFVAFVVFLVAFVVAGLTVVFTFIVLDSFLPDSVVEGTFVVDFLILLPEVLLSMLGLTVVYLQVLT